MTDYEMTHEECLKAKAATIDPREVLESEPVSINEVREGDWIRAAGWSRPRRVELIDTQPSPHDSSEAEPVLFLAEPDTSRQNADGRVRRVDLESWEARSGWARFPHLRAIWDAAHAS